MYKKNSFSRGAISIFLVIVLVPSIVVSSLFVDASRVKSARGLVSSAGELTLNTVLSQYDVDLNDFYGLMASAQDMEDVLSAAEEYFTACIKSQDINTTDSTKWANSIKNIFLEDGDISDLLGLGLAQDSAVTVQPTANGSLTNPALVKTQMVEFMKYRSPINSIVDLYQKFQDSSKDLENSKKSSDLVDKKQDYYEAQGKVAEKAYDIFQKIGEYNKLGINSADLQEIKTFVNSLEEKYKSCHIKMVKDLYNTQGLSSDDIRQCRRVPEPYTHQSKYNNASAKTIGGLIDKLMRSYDQFINAKKSFDNNIKPWSTSGNKYYDVQYWAYCCKNKSYFTNVFNKETNLCDSYVNLLDAVEHAVDGAIDEEYISTYNSTNISGVVKGTKKSIASWWSLLDNKATSAIDSVTKTSNYNTAVVKVSDIVNKANLRDRISTSSTDSSIADYYNILNDYHTRYKKAYDLLDEIADGLDDLKTLVNTADTNFENWEDKADEYYSDISLAKSDKAEIEEVKTNEQSPNKKLKQSDIQDYLNHINNVKSAVGTIKEGTTKIKYCGQSILDKKINGYSQFRKYSNVEESSIPMYEADLNDYANSTFEFSMEGSGISSLIFTENNDPNIANKSKFVVYKWMIDQGFQLDKDVEGTKKKYNERKKETEKLADDAETTILTDVASKNDISELDGLPSGTSENVDAAKITTKIKEISTFVGDLFGNFGSTVAQAGADIRDDLFTVDYVTSMFTWQTFEYEAKYDMLENSEQRNITFENAQSYYSNKDDAWQSTDVRQKFNKTLTNKLRNSESTNWSYCNEVEYIMYGKSIADSKGAMNRSIYMIRFALNIPAVFSTYYNDNELRELATSINIGTHGIIPAGLVKVVVCLGLTALESARDLKTLRCGIPVILIKTKKDDLFVDGCLTFHAGSNPQGTDKTKAVTFSYSDYMKLILFVKLLGSNQYNIYGRIADVIQTNMSECVLDDTEYSFAKSQVYYSINTSVKVKPLLLDISYVKSFMNTAPDRMDNWSTITYSATRGY